MCPTNGVTDSSGINTGVCISTCTLPRQDSQRLFRCTMACLDVELAHRPGRAKASRNWDFFQAELKSKRNIHIRLRSLLS